MSDKLRFKDEHGQDYPEWEERFLSECGKFKKGKGLNKDDISNTGNDCILYGDLYTKYNEIITSVENKTETKITNPTLSKKGDILFPSSTTASALSLIAPSSIKQNNVIIGGDIIVFTPNNDINSDFLSYQINHFRKTQFAKYAEGITIVHIYSNLLGENIISIPSIKEQQKIADFLSTVDDKIENQKEIVANWEEIKKGLIQKIFSQEIRFKDENGQDYPEWISYLFKQCFIHEGGTSLEQYVTTDGQYHFISIGNYSTDGRYIDNGQRIDFNSKSKGKILNKNDLVMVLNDKTSSGDLIGSTIIIKENDKYVYNQRSERIKCLDKIKPMFAWHILNSKKFRNEIFSRAQGGTQIYINFPSIENIEMKIPTTEEQQKIADFLSTIDDKIEYEKNMLNELIELKKGLLQRIFKEESKTLFKSKDGE